MPQSIGRNESFGGDDEGEEADYGEGGDEDGGVGCYRSLHQYAVSGVGGEHDNWGY